MGLFKSNKVKAFLYNFYYLKMLLTKNNYKHACFKYSYSGFQSFENQLEENGSYTVNIGDNIQALAIKNLYGTLGINNVQYVDRDTMHKYRGEPLRVIMNAVIYQKSFPFKDKIWPYFLGINIKNNNIKKILPYLKKYEPIGCRDIATCEELTKANIKAYVTGCYSITLQKRQKEPSKEKIFFVGVSDELKRHIPEHLLKKSVFIEQREPMQNFPLTEKDMAFAEKRATELLQMYKEEATLVVTPLLHCSSPCIGMGIPVILARDDDNPRFSAIKKITKLYLKDEYPKIDWNPEAIDVEELKKNMIEHARIRLLEDRIDPRSLEYLNSVYQKCDK